MDLTAHRGQSLRPCPGPHRLLPTSGPGPGGPTLTLLSPLASVCGLTCFPEEPAADKASPLSLLPGLCCSLTLFTAEPEERGTEPGTPPALPRGILGPESSLQPERANKMGTRPHQGSGQSLQVTPSPCAASEAVPGASPTATPVLDSASHARSLPPSRTSL